MTKHVWRYLVITLAVCAAVGGGTFLGQSIAKDLLIGGQKPVEGTSMSHGPTRQAGILDDRDYGISVPVQFAAEIRTFSEGGGQTIGGEVGDIIKFLPYGAGRLVNGTWVLDPEIAPPAFVFADPRIIVHRAIAWIEFNQTTGNFDAPRNGLLNITYIVIDDVPYVDHFNYSYLRSSHNLTLVFRNETATIYPRGMHSGFITKGDYEVVDDQHPGRKDENGKTVQEISPIVKPSWVIGKVVRIVDRETIELVDQITCITIVVGEIAVAAVAVWFWRRKT